MIDALELRIPVTVPRGPIWARNDIRPAKRVHKGNYEMVQDLRPHVPLQICWDHHFSHERKLQFVGVAALDAAAILTSITNIFDVDPLCLELVRVDFAVDIEIPLQWFAENLTVGRKRRRDGWAAEARHSRWEGTTLYFGKRPSIIRVYDKAAEQKCKGRGISKEILTRVEHEVYRAALGKMGLRTLGDLLQRAGELKPFASVHLPEQAILRATESRPPLKTYLASLGLARELATMSRAQLELHYKNMGYRNAARDLNKVSPFMTTRNVDVPDLSSLFSVSVMGQLFGDCVELIEAA